MPDPAIPSGDAETAACLAAKPTRRLDHALGGLPEALLLAKAVPPMLDPFTAKNALKDPKTGNSKSNLREWSSADLSGGPRAWLIGAAKAVSHTIRDFRNLVSQRRA
jgi:hypothetical protein